MRYVTISDLIAFCGEEELVQLTDRAGTGTLNAVLLERAIDQVCTEIDGYLATRYTLPLPMVPPFLQRIAIDLVREALWTDGAPEGLAKRAENGRKSLRDIGKGALQLEQANGAMPAPAAQTVHVLPKAREVW